MRLNLMRRASVLFCLGFLGLAACGEDAQDDAALVEDELRELESLTSDEAPEQELIELGGKSDLASNVFYRCVTASEQGGTRWTYQTSFVNNTRQRIQVYIYARSGSQRPNAYGPLYLNKIGTDLWKDAAGKITLRLVQKGAGKSIRVFHNSINLLASEANGWCSTVDVTRNIDPQYAHDFFYGGRLIVSGYWKFLAVNDQLIDSETAYGFSYRQAYESNPSRMTGGSMDLYRRCNPIATPTYQPVVTGANQRALNTLQGFVDAKFLIEQIIELYRCVRNRDDLLIPITRSYRAYMWNVGGDFGIIRNRPHVPSSFLSACGTSTTTLFVEVLDDQGRPATLSCMQIFSPSAQTSYMRMKAYSLNGGGESPWATFMKD